MSNSLSEGYVREPKNLRSWKAREATLLPTRAHLLPPEDNHLAGRYKPPLAVFLSYNLESPTVDWR